MASHGNTPAAWTAVVVAMVGFTVAGVALVLSPINTTLFIGAMVVAVAAWPLFLVMSKLGFHEDRH